MLSGGGMWSAGPGDDAWRVLKIRFKPVETDPLVPIYGGGPWERWPRTWPSTDSQTSSGA
jgi:hypothetical protein